MILVSWSWSLLLSVPPLLGWGHFTPEESGQSCAPDWRRREDKPYNLFLFTFGFFLPLTVIVISSLAATLRLRKTTNNIHNTEIKALARRRQMSVLKMVSVVKSVGVKSSETKER